MTEDAGDEEGVAEDGDSGESLDSDETFDTPVEEADREETDLGDNVFGGPLDRGPVEPGRPDAENVLFVLLGILLGTLVIMRLIGAI